jgi:hypothetical protein
MSNLGTSVLQLAVNGSAILRYGEAEAGVADEVRVPSQCPCSEPVRTRELR